MIAINRVIKNFLSVSFANIFSQILTFMVVTYYAGVLGTSIFGQLSTVQAIIIYFTMFVMLGLQTYGTREVSKSEANIDSIVGNIILLRTLTFFISYFILILFTLIYKGNLIFNNLLLIYGLTLLPSALSLDWVFSGLQEMQYNAVYNLIKNLLPCIFIFLFLKNKEHVYLIPIFTIFGLLSALIYQFFIFFIKKKLRIAVKINIKDIKKYIIYGFPFMISGILAMINCNVDKIVINFTRGAGEAGIYSAGYNIILFLTNVITLIFTPIFPLLISYYHENDIQKLKAVINNIVKIIAFIALPIFAGGVLLSKEIILLLFKKEYLEGYVSFAILMGYILILFIREIYGYCLNAWNIEKSYLKIVLISSMVNLVLNIIFTPFYGMNIAAIITVFSEIINLVLMRKYANKVLEIKVFKYLKKALVPTLIMSFVILVIRYLNLNILINILVAIIVYFTSAINLKVISLGELKSSLYKKEGSL